MTNGARSAIPRVMGILMIIFAGLGILQTLFTFLGAIAFQARDLDGQLEKLETMVLVFAVIDLGVGLLHLAAGITAIRYKAGAWRLAVAFAASRIVVTTANIAFMIYTWVMPSRGSMSGGEAAIVVLIVVVTTTVSLAWPVVVLALMSRPAARAACVN